MSEQKTYKLPANRVGYVSKSKTGKSMITVEQDIVLKKGQKIILDKMDDVYARMEASGKIKPEVIERIRENTPEWKTHEVSVLPDLAKN